MKTACLTTHGIAFVCLSLAAAMTVQSADRHVPGGYSTIQAAVDATEPGDTIRIAPGVYVEQASIIGKDLSLIGSPATTIRAFVGMQSPLSDLGASPPALVGIADADVVVSGIHFEGERLGDDVPGELRGIYCLGANGGQTERREYFMNWEIKSGQSDEHKETEVVLSFVDFPGHHVGECSNMLAHHLRAEANDEVKVVFEVTLDFGKVRGFNPIEIAGLKNWQPEWSYSGTSGSPRRSPWE